MSAESWIRKISENDRSQKVLRLTDAKERIPIAAYIEGDSPDPYVAHPTLFPVEITWASGKPTKHFVRGDSNKYMITDRSDAVGIFYAGVASSVTHIVITAVDDGKFLVTPLQNA
jgi:hypothetical protein